MGSGGCLGVWFFGECQYNPANPHISYFTIGELIAVIALLLAFSQLISAKYSFRLRVAGFKGPRMFWGASAAAASVFTAMLLPIPITPWTPLPIIGYPIFWELVAASIVTLGALWIIGTIWRPARFTENNATRYFQSFLSAIERGNEIELREIGQDLYSALPEIFEFCSRYDASAARRAKEQGIEYVVDQSTRTAFSLLEFCSDALFCRNLVCRVPRTATEILQHIADKKIKFGVYSLVQNIVEEAFENPDSILYREGRFSALERVSNNFTQTAFGTMWLIEEHKSLRGFSYWKGSALTAWKVKRYFEVLEVAVEAYFEAGDFYSHSFGLYNGFSIAGRLASSTVIDADSLPEGEGFRAESLAILTEIQNGFGEIIKLISENHKRLPKYKFDRDKDRFQESNIYRYVADAVYEYFIDLAGEAAHEKR